MSTASVVQPLNPVLYGLLRGIFRTVRIANEGTSMIGAPSMTSAFDMPVIGNRSSSSVLPWADSPSRRSVSVPLTWGEYYRVCCPFCRDGRYRLWINHLYGTKNSEGVPQAWLAHCYNNECTTKVTNRQQLENMIFGVVNRRDRPNMSIMPGEDTSAELIVVQPPPVIPLDRLLPQHPARVYLISRGFDPDYLARYYGVGYITHTPTEQRGADNRIYTPIYMNGQLVGWQGRYIGDPDWSNKALRLPPKYFNTRAGHKSRMLYNYDSAKLWPFVVVCEGITDVWRIGGPAVALFGKSMSGQQRMLLNDWAGKPVIVALDSDARDKSEGIFMEIRRYGASPVVILDLPEGMDPASYTHEVVVSMIRHAASTAGISLPEW